MANIINSLTFGSGTYVFTTPYATSSTVAGTAAKVATLTPNTNFSLETGARVTVKFDAANSAASPTLNVNQSGAKTIRFRGAALASAFYWEAGSVVDFVYDGTYWNITGSPHNSTYSLSSFGITASATELNYTDGVTSNIQTQLNGKASTSHDHVSLNGKTDTRDDNTTPNDYNALFKVAGLKYNSAVGLSASGSYCGVIGFRQWSDSSGGDAHELAFSNDGLHMRMGATSTWGAWQKFLTSSNFTVANSAPTLSWGTTSTIGTVGGTALTVKMPSNPNTNTAHSHTAGTGLTLTTGSGGTSGTTTYAANLNSTTSLGTIGTTSKLYAVGVDSAGKLCVNVPWTDTNTDTNTHYTTKLFATSSTGTAHAATTNGNTYLRLFDDSTARQSIKITGSGATTVTSDANGVITISSTDTNTNTDTKVTQGAVITTSGSYPVMLGYSTATTSVTNTLNKSSKLLFNPSTGALSIGTSGTDGSGSITLEGSLTLGSSQSDSQGIMPRQSNWNSLGMYNKYWYRAYVSTVYCSSIKTLSGGTFSFPATITWNTF